MAEAFSAVTRKTAIDTYGTEVAKYKTLSKSTETELLKRAKTDLDAKNRLVEANLRFVVSVATKYREYGIPLDELISEGNLGLIEAIERFDTSKSVRLITYAVYYIRLYIKKYIEQVTEEQKRISNDAEIANYGYEDEFENDEVTQSYRLLTHIDMAEDEEEENTGYNVTPKQKKLLKEMLSSLSERERTVLTAFFGIGCKRQTLAELSDSLGVSKERVRQIKDRALSILRTEVMKNTQFSCFFSNFS
jgi:RNA polymerase primary sigma factor